MASCSRAHQATAFDSRKDLWNEVGRAAASTVIRFHVAMPHGRFPELEARLAQISDPKQ